MPSTGKKILILGNGFDLAHGLPTKYSHFLEFCLRVQNAQDFGIDNNKQTTKNFKRLWIDNWETDVSIKDAILTEFYLREITPHSDGTYEKKITDPTLSEMLHLLYDNIWYEYFIELYRNKCINGENWIDFESEIRFIIKKVDHKSFLLTDFWDDVQKDIIGSSEDFKVKTFCEKLTFNIYMQKKGLKSEHRITIKDFREKTFEDLERLTRVLELYLSSFVESIPVNKKIYEIENLFPDYIINFNYTNTYERIYNKENIYHIHGKADATRPASKNDMVLGIDEYWSENERDDKTNFTIFKKFAQRIQKHTGNESYKYLEEIQQLFKSNKNVKSDSIDASKDSPNGVSYIYVFGHSLDVTDKDILSSFIGDDSTSVVVYCMDKETEGELIANTIKLIGERRLLDKLNHVPPKLNYVVSKKKMTNYKIDSDVEATKEYEEFATTLFLTAQKEAKLRREKIRDESIRGRRFFCINENDPTSIHYVRNLDRPNISWFTIFLHIFIPVLIILAITKILLLIHAPLIISFAISYILMFFYVLLRLKKIFICCVRIYQHYAPNSIRMKCRFEPSCSQYMIISIEKYGAIKGLQRGINRIRRCKIGNGGYDYP